ncbi:MAG: hypothetical protein ACR2PX_20685, partial [Endozoicomonas sp.]|uniref:hypothetical protein n=1 Tax=Endozoicomonas sp. TaxID=1892382 RepID=UPI003D9BB027
LSSVHSFQRKSLRRKKLFNSLNWRTLMFNKRLLFLFSGGAFYRVSRCCQPDILSGDSVLLLWRLAPLVEANYTDFHEGFNTQRSTFVLSPNI